MPIRTYLGGEYINSTLTRIDGDPKFVPGIRVKNSSWSDDFPPGIVIDVEFEENCGVFPSSVTVFWTSTPKITDFSSMTMPITRRVFPSLLANEIVSIQPMTQPAGAIFYLDYKYGSGSLGGSVKKK